MQLKFNFFVILMISLFVAKISFDSFSTSHAKSSNLDQSSQFIPEAN